MYTQLYSYFNVNYLLSEQQYDFRSQHSTELELVDYILKGNAAYLKFFFIMDENDALSEYNKIPLGHNRTNGVVYSKIYFKVEICSAH